MTSVKPNLKKSLAFHSLAKKQVQKAEIKAEKETFDIQRWRKPVRKATKKEYRFYSGEQFESKKNSFAESQVHQSQKNNWLDFKSIFNFVINTKSSDSDNSAKTRVNTDLETETFEKKPEKENSNFKKHRQLTLNAKNNGEKIFEQTKLTESRKDSPKTQAENNGRSKKIGNQNLKSKKDKPHFAVQKTLEKPLHASKNVQNVLLNSNSVLENFRPKSFSQEAIFEEAFVKDKQKTNLNSKKTLKNLKKGNSEISNNDWKRQLYHSDKKFSLLGFFCKKRGKILLALLLTLFLFAGVFQRGEIVSASTMATFPPKEDLSKKFPKEYVEWIIDRNSDFSAPDIDLDADGLLNFEEFTLQTNPTKANTCNPKKTDSQNLVELVNPATCKKIDLNDKNQLEKFNQVINVGRIKKEILEKSITEKQNVKTKNVAGSLLTMYGVSNFNQLENLNENQIANEKSKIDEKITTLRKIKRIDKYIADNRSYEIFDRDYATPVSSSYYLEVSMKYNVNLKYVLALAQSESRFGTDRFTISGQLTRPGKYKNIYSIGLDDSGNNLGFNSWEEGVEAFGKWYSLYRNKGVADCAKWRIYNPNGDYCQKIEVLAGKIDAYLKA